jgi:hypothetical protein
LSRWWDSAIGNTRLGDEENSRTGCFDVDTAILAAGLVGGRRLCNLGWLWGALASVARLVGRGVVE